jgi:hypothetical protein
MLQYQPPGYWRSLEDSRYQRSVKVRTQEQDKSYSEGKSIMEQISRERLLREGSKSIRRVLRSSMKDLTNYIKEL